MTSPFAVPQNGATAWRFRVHEPCLLVDRPDDGVVLLTLNRPQSLNAVNLELAALLAATLTATAQDASVRAVVLTGAGERAFSAGYDIREMAAMEADAIAQATLRRSLVIRALARHPQPVIAALNGVTHGAGALYALAADIRLASPHTELRIAAVRHGVAEGTWQLANIVGPARAKEILMTGRAVDAQEGLSIGLYHALEPAETLLAAALAKARQIAAHPAAGPQHIKRLIDEAAGRSLDDQFHAEQLTLATTSPAANGAATFADFLSRTTR